jgi:L-threonylcarbamoyladenylate synthase
MPATQILHVDPHHPNTHVIALAAEALAAGKLVAFPTETVYGLGANALDAAAVERIFAAKRRPHNDPLIVHVAAIEQVAEIAEAVPPAALRLGAALWPGPLTLVLRRGPHVAPNVSGGRATVAVRIPNHPVAQALLRASGLPVAAPSANLFTRPSPTTAQHVLDDLAGRIDLVLDGGPTTIGLESTVVDMTQEPPVLLRPGGAPVETLRALAPTLIAPERALIQREDEAAAGPGMLLKHYAPRTRVLVLAGAPPAALSLAAAVAEHLRQRGLSLGVLASAEEAAAYAALGAQVISLGAADDPATAARLLFAHLRALEAQDIHLILARALPAAGLGLAVADRLYRAAEGQVIDADAGGATEAVLALIA